MKTVSFFACLAKRIPGGAQPSWISRRFVLRGRWGVRLRRGGVVRRCRGRGGWRCGSAI